MRTARCPGAAVSRISGRFLKADTLIPGDNIIPLSLEVKYGLVASQCIVDLRTFPRPSATLSRTFELAYYYQDALR